MLCTRTRELRRRRRHHHQHHHHHQITGSRTIAINFIITIDTNKNNFFSSSSRYI